MEQAVDVIEQVFFADGLARIGGLEMRQAFIGYAIAHPDGLEWALVQRGYLARRSLSALHLVEEHREALAALYIRHHEGLN
jgi:hypothetical protein